MKQSERLGEIAYETFIRPLRQQGHGVVPWGMLADETKATWRAVAEEVSYAVVSNITLVPEVPSVPDRTDDTSRP